MSAATGREIVTGMLELGAEFARWTKQYISRAEIIEQLDQMGLTHHQVEILGFLHTNPELNTVSALAAELFISKGSLSLMLSKLQRGGYVQKKAAREEDDGRKVYVSLTKKGSDAVEKVRELILSRSVEVFENMEPEQRTLFNEKIKELKNLLYIGGLKE